MKKNVLKRTSILLALLSCMNIVGCQKKDVNNNEKENGKAVSSEKANMTGDGKDENNVFKPSDYCLKEKKEYIYEYIGLKFKLSDKVREEISNKKIAMLDDQSPVDKDLKHAILTFNKMTEEQKNAVINKMGDGYEKWQKGLQRMGTIGMFSKEMSEKEISEITKCSNHKKIGTSKDGKYDYYISSNEKIKDGFIEEFAKTKIEIIDKKERPKNGFVLSEKADSKDAEASDKASNKDLSNIVTKDINGKEFSNKDFSKYDITMVNVFATWCTACIKEIPELEELYKEMKSKGVNIVGVVTDTVDESGENKEAIEKAKLIQEKTKSTYSFLMPDKTNFNSRLNGIQALPETFFVDKNGKIIGETYSGAHDIKGWKEIIEKELKKVKK